MLTCHHFPHGSSYAGSWDTVTGHQANLFPPPSSPDGLSTGAALRHFTSHGVAIEKLVLGIPLYGRSFANTEGPEVGKAYSGVGKGSWEAGVYDYKALVSLLRNSGCFWKCER